MSSKKFEFNGDWEYDIELSEFSGFQDRNGAYTSISSNKPNKGIFKLGFEDDLTENPDPYPEQLNTVKYIFENQAAIARSIIERTLSELPEILVNYDLENEEGYKNLTPEKIKSLIGISTFNIKIISKDNYSYFDISGGCNWDEEHGLNFLLHKDRVISFGGIDGNSTYEAQKDNGTYHQDENHHLEIEKPKKYLPHPKYNKLKPVQKFANETYEFTLISYGHNEEFIKGVESGEIDINGKWISQDKTYLETACGFNNNELVKYLLDKNAETRYAFRQCVYGNNYEAMKMLLDKGADINYQYGNGNTALFEIVSSMESLYRANDYYREINRPDLITKDNMNRLDELKNKIRDLIQIGADPGIKNYYGFNCFDIMRDSTAPSRNEVNVFLNKCLSEK